jgi:hypothetical protein
MRGGQAPDYNQGPGWEVFRAEQEIAKKDLVWRARQWEAK